MTAALLIPLVVALLMLPTPALHRFDGLPLSSLPEFVALLLLLPLLASRALRRLFRRFLRLAGPRAARLMAGALLLAAGAKLLLLSANVQTGFRACYQSAPGPVAATCEKSYENAFFRDRVTRLEDAIDAGPRTWNLSFFNSIRFNLYPWETGNRFRDRLPFVATWRGEIDLPEPTNVEITYVGEGDLAIPGAPAVRLTPTYASSRTVTVPAPAGRRTLSLAYKFDDGSRVGDGIFHGPYATLRVRARSARDVGAPLAPLRAANPPLVWRSVGVVADVALAAALFAVLLFYWRLLARDREILAILGVAGLGLAIDPTASIAWPPPLDYVHPEAAVGLPNGLGLTILTCVIFLLLLRRRSARQPLVAFFALAWAGFFRKDLLLRGFELVFYRPAGDDWLTYESFARSILESWSLEAGEAVFYYQPLFRYIKFVEHLMFGDGDTLIALFAQTLLVWSIFWMAFRLLPRRRAPAAWRAIGLTGALLLAVLAVSEPVTRLIYVGASEYPTWIALALLFPRLYVSRSMREQRTGVMLLGLSAITRMNQAIALAWMLLVFVWRLRSLRPWFAVRAVAVVTAIGLLPILHNLYYGGELSALPREHNVARTLVLPPASWLRVSADADIRALAVKQVGALTYTSRLAVGTPWVPTPSSHVIVGIAFHGLQAIWGLAVVVVWMDRRINATVRLLVVLPVLYLAPHLFYQVVDYHPRFIVVGHLAMGAVGLLAVREKGER